MSDTYLYGNIHLTDGKDNKVDFILSAPIPTINFKCPNLTHNGVDILSGVPGSDLGVVFNNAGSLDTDPLFQWDTSASELTVPTIKGLGLPLTSDSAANKDYVDAIASLGVSWKNSVRVSTTGPLTLATDFEDGDVIDGVTIDTGNRILIKDQASGIENGIYVVKASGAPDRSADLPLGAEARATAVWVNEGTTGADTGEICTNDLGSDIVGTDALVFTEFGTVSPGLITLQTVTDAGATTNNAISITDTTQSTSFSTGAVTIDGGIGIAKRMHLGGDLNFDTPTLVANNVTASPKIFDTTTTGQITIGAGLTTGDISFGSTAAGHNSHFLGTDESTSSTTGAVIIDGGLGIKKNLVTDGTFILDDYAFPDGHIIGDIFGTGLFSGGNITADNPFVDANFSVSDGEGVITDVADPLNPVTTTVNWTGLSAQTVTSPLSAQTWIYITSVGAVLQSTVDPTPELRRDNILLGKVFLFSSTISAANDQPDVVMQSPNQLLDFTRGIGPVIFSGLRCSANGANLSLDRTSGDLHEEGINFAANVKSPNVKTFATDTLASFIRTTQGPIIDGTLYTILDPSNYDLANTITPIPGSGSRASNVRIYFYNSGVITMQYGQEWYGTLAGAISGVATEPYIPQPFNANGILICVISVRSDATDLSDSTQARFSSASKFGEISLGTAGAATSNFQNVYDNSSQPQIVVDSTSGSLQIQDNPTPIVAPLFEIRDSIGADILTVSDDSLTIDGRSRQINDLSITLQNAFLDPVSGGGHINGCRALLVEGDFAFVGNSAGDNFIAVYDISDIDNITHHVDIAQANLQSVENIIIIGNFLFALSKQTSRVISFDITNLYTSGAYTFLDESSGMTFPSDMTSDGVDHLFVGNNTSLSIFDVSDPAVITTLTGVALTGVITKTSYANDHVYVETNAAIIHTVDVTTRTAAVYLGAPTDITGHEGMSVFEDRLVCNFTTGDFLRVYDLDVDLTIAGPVLLGTFAGASPGATTKTTTLGRNVYSIVGTSLYVYDIIDPTDIRISGSLAEGTMSNGNEINYSKYVFVLSFNADGFFVFDIEDNTQTITVNVESLYSTVNNDLSVLGIGRMKNETNSTSSTSGSLVVTGGAGISKDLNVGQSVKILGTTPSTSILTGALTVGGGIGCLGKFYPGDSINMTVPNISSLNVATAVSLFDTTTTGDITIAGGLTTGDLTLGNSTANNSVKLLGNFPQLGDTGSNQVTIRTTTNGSISVGASGPTTGDITIGSAMTGGDIFLGTSGHTGATQARGTTNSTSTTTGSVKLDGGLGVAKDIYCDNIYANNLTASPTTGTVTQLTSMSTGVTLNTMAGRIDLFGTETILSDATKYFTLTNSNILTTSLIFLTLLDTFADNMMVSIRTLSVAGSCSIAVGNCDTATRSSGFPIAVIFQIINV